MRSLYTLMSAGCLIFLFSTAGCEGFDLPFGKKKKISLNDIIEAKKQIDQVSKAFEVTRLTPEQEHYVGRSVAASILQEYPLYENPLATMYLNLVGEAVAKASDRPETFKGYNFAILDTDEINGFATPGGFIFVTRGLLRCCSSEDAVAAVLAHEVGHVVYKHGLRSIKAKRLMPFANLLLSKSLEGAGGDTMKKLTGAFGESVNDVTNQLVHGKYSRATEVKADAAAVAMLEGVGYDPNAFTQVLSEMKTRFKAEKRGFYKSHPDPEWRIRNFDKLINKDKVLDPPPDERMARFRKALADI